MGIDAIIPIMPMPPPQPVTHSNGQQTGHSPGHETHDSLERERRHKRDAHAPGHARPPAGQGEKVDEEV